MKRSCCARACVACAKQLNFHEHETAPFRPVAGCACRRLLRHPRGRSRARAHACSDELVQALGFRPRDHRVGHVAVVEESHQHGHGPAGPHLGGRGRELPQPREAPAGGRPHHGLAGHRRRRQGGQVLGLRAGAVPPRADGHRRDRQPDHRLDDAGSDRLHGCEPQRQVRSRHRQARGHPHRLQRPHPRPLAAQRHRGAGRAMVLERGQQRRAVHGQVRQDLPHWQRLRSLLRPQQSRRPRLESARDCRREVRRWLRVDWRLCGAHEPGRLGRAHHRSQLPQQLRADGEFLRRCIPERQRRSPRVPRRVPARGRQRRLLLRRWQAHLAGGSPARPERADRRVAAGRPGHHAVGRRVWRRLAHGHRVRRGQRAGRKTSRPPAQLRAGPQHGVRLLSAAGRRGLQAGALRLPHEQRGRQVRRQRFPRRQQQRHHRAAHVLPPERRDGRRGRCDLCGGLVRSARRRARGSGRLPQRHHLSHCAEGLQAHGAEGGSQHARRRGGRLAQPGGERARRGVLRGEGIRHQGPARFGKAPEGRAAAPSRARHLAPQSPAPREGPAVAAHGGQG